MKKRTRLHVANGSGNGQAGRPAANRDIHDIHVALVEESGMTLFTEQYGQEWARIPVGGHHETHRLRSKAFRNWLHRYYWRRGQDVSQRFLRERIGLLEALADGERRELGTRSTWSEDRKALWIDLADRAWRAVRVTPEGWAVEADPPSLFFRFAHQQPLPEPDHAGDIKELLAYLPPLSSEGDRLLLLVWAVGAFVPMPRPILTLVGQHGSAKSTLSMFLRRLLDPSRVELLGRDARSDLPLVFHKHAVPVFDNTDGMTPHEADLFCQAVTGRGIARRKLYTDAEEFILSFQRAVVVNGLRLPTNRPDFLDRALIFDLERLPPERREVLAKLDAEFTAALPRLLGGLLNALGRTLALLPTVSAERLGRMADFHRFGRAAAGVLGSTPGQFDDAFQAAEARQKRGAFDNTLALAVLLFAREVRRWQGEATDLLQRLHETAQASHIRRSPEFWPDSPAGLGGSSSTSGTPWPATASGSRSRGDPRRG
jgi:hypothetical protein